MPRSSLSPGASRSTPRYFAQSPFYRLGQIADLHHLNLYCRCGVLLTEPAPETQQQTSLFATQSYDRRKQILMRAVDRLNAEWGQGALRHAREGMAQT